MLIVIITAFTSSEVHMAHTLIILEVRHSQQLFQLCAYMVCLLVLASSITEQRSSRLCKLYSKLSAVPSGVANAAHVFLQL